MDETTDQVEQALESQGVATETPVPEDYFGFDVTHRVMLPDKVSWVEFKELNEGQRRQYLNQSNRKVRMQRATGDTIMDLAAGDDRYNLLKVALTGWNLYKQGEPVPFSRKNLEEFLEKASPTIIDKIEKQVRKHNPWLLQDVTVEDIDEQIAELQELRKEKAEEQEGKDT